jgi:hypothetical protein
MEGQPGGESKTTSNASHGEGVVAGTLQSVVEGLSEMAHEGVGVPMEEVVTKDAAALLKTGTNGGGKAH